LKEEKIIKNDVSDWTKIPFYKPVKKGDDDGYSGRVGIYEVLPVTESIKSLIMKEVDASEIHTQARTEGMRTMLEDGLVKAVQGLTTVEEVFRVISE
jgi:type II secretory ATPase GspE/PulE/Tfp pilus assembly ATPase PilB-like protein